ncbi:MAG TPA: pilus assembly protein TadG-related protein [Acidimicrobiales bacterium]|nr:pilus assembly protein TadG-related protein [Acidimicrobiales bacterium]
MAREQRRGRGRDERGATLVFTAMCMVVLLWAGAVGIDVGFSVYGSRQAQAMADTAALDMARYINIADAQTTNFYVQNYLNGKLSGVDTDNSSNAALTVTPGLWLNGAWSVPGPGCAPTTPPAAHPCNAVMVTANQSVPQIFFGGFNVLSSHSGANATTIAAVTPEAAFTIGSFLAAFNAQQTAVLNVILSQLGTTANVSASGYQGLANTYVTISQLIAASSGLLNGGNVMTTPLSANQWLTIWQAAVASQVSGLNCSSTPTPSPCNASTALSSLTFSGSNSVELCQLVSVDGSSCGSGVLTTPGLTASLDVLQTLTTEAEVANAGSGFNVQSALGITGVTSSTLTVTVGQVPQVGYGPVTTTTASPGQVTADLNLNVQGQGILDIPLSAASGTATLKTVNCYDNAMTSTKISATTTATSGTVTLGGTSIATLSIGGYSGPQISFAGGTGGVVPPTASTQSADTNPITVGSNSPTLSYSGLSTSSPVYTLLTSTLAGVLGPVLQAAGVPVGGAEVADLSTNCDAVSIVQ